MATAFGMADPPSVIRTCRCRCKPRAVALRQMCRSHPAKGGTGPWIPFVAAEPRTAAPERLPADKLPVGYEVRLVVYCAKARPWQPGKGRRNSELACGRTPDCPAA